MNSSIHSQSWGKYNITDENRQPFREITHTSHIEPALEIIRKQHINSSRVHSIEPLKERQSSVIWLSPNDWGGVGSRYGTVSFLFDFKTLIEGKNLYFVGILPHKITACRILVTHKDYSDIYSTYNPSQDKGPWVYEKSTDTHFFNKFICLEFMLESEENTLPLNKLTSFCFIDHNSNFCSEHSENPEKCDEFKKRASYGCAKLIAKSISQKIDISPIKNLIKAPIFTMDNAVSEIIVKVTDRSKIIYTKKINPTDKLSFPLANAILQAYAEDNIKCAQAISSLFHDESHLISFITRIIVEYFAYSPGHQFSID